MEPLTIDQALKQADAGLAEMGAVTPVKARLEFPYLVVLSEYGIALTQKDLEITPESLESLRSTDGAIVLRPKFADPLVQQSAVNRWMEWKSYAEGAALSAELLAQIHAAERDVAADKAVEGAD